MNDEENDDDLVEWIVENGEEVFSRAWDSCGPGAGEGCEYVYCWEGQYVMQSVDYGDSGPYQSLDETIAEHDLLMVTSATTSIDCSLWTARQLLNRLDSYVEEDGFELRLNGDVYVYRAAKKKFLQKPQPKKTAKGSKR